ncbi:MAG: hypothetical protein SFW67_21335 [Myxococcaceae bacterium]|nr:hypothetical protein [Myxococcaceae bacterium]
MGRLSCLGVAAFAVGCAPAWPEGVTTFSETAPAASDAQSFWRDQGFVPLVPAVPLPTSSDGRMRIEVWARLPDGARLSHDDRGRPVFPPGSEVIRLELWRTRPEPAPGLWVLADARGTRLEPSGLQRYSLRRPMRLAPGSTWVGAEWAGDRHRTVSEGVLAGFQRALKLDDGAVQRLRTQNQCPACHQPNLEQGPPPIRRGTDGHGFYVPATILAKTTPIEAYRDREPHGPGLDVKCNDGAEARVVTTPEGGWHHECGPQAFPLGTVDRPRLAGELLAHLAAHCASERWLSAHGDFSTTELCPQTP